MLLSEANNDPVKKADLIRDVVKSIAVIPEAITRTVYIKECSTVLEVSEPILYHEVNKLRQQKTFQDRNKYPGPEDLPVPPPVIEKPIPREAFPFHSEEEIIRLLLKYSLSEFEQIINREDGKEEVISVSDYIVREITSDELSFDIPLFAKIFEEFRFAASQGTFIQEKQFIKHEDPAISQKSADLLCEHHTLSKIYANKQTYVETEEMKLKEMVSDAVLKFKSDKIRLKMKEIIELMVEAEKGNDTEKVMALLKRHSNMSLALLHISRKLGNRILL